MKQWKKHVLTPDLYGLDLFDSDTIGPMITVDQ